MNGHSHESFEPSIDISVAIKSNPTVARGEGYLQAGSEQALGQPVSPSQFQQLIVHERYLSVAR